MTELPLPKLQAVRDRLYVQLATVGDFRRGQMAPVPGRVYGDEVRIGSRQLSIGILRTLPVERGVWP
jgi:hypothetical protein